MTLRGLLLGALLLHAADASGQSGFRTENVFLVTIDGLRWREVFAGADSSMLGKAPYVAPHVRDSVATYLAPTAQARRHALMPFLWGTVARQGQLFGNRETGCVAEVTNGMWYSYPGYNEILTGRADDQRINSNSKILNPNLTFLEVANRTDGFRGRVAAFGSWEVFPYIIHEERSGVPVNAGFELAEGSDLSATERMLNELQRRTVPLHSSRADVVTHGYAMEHLRKRAPRLLYVAYNDVDQFAHTRNYEGYLRAIHDVDDFLAELWAHAQAHPQYRDNTTLVVLTDHGRGEGDRWTDHNRRVEHADEIWMAAMGPDTPATGEVARCHVRQNQIARTVTTLLGLDFPGGPGIGEPIGSVLGRR